MILDYQSLEAVLTVNMEALEQFGVFEGVQADSTRELVLQFLEGLLGYSLGFGHCHSQGLRGAINGEIERLMLRMRGEWKCSLCFLCVFGLCSSGPAHKT